MSESLLDFVHQESETFRIRSPKDPPFRVEEDVSEDPLSELSFEIFQANLDLRLDPKRSYLLGWSLVKRRMQYLKNTLYLFGANGGLAYGRCYTTLMGQPYDKKSSRDVKVLDDLLKDRLVIKKSIDSAKERGYLPKWIRKHPALRFLADDVKVPDEYKSDLMKFGHRDIDSVLDEFNGIIYPEKPTEDKISFEIYEAFHAELGSSSPHLGIRLTIVAGNHVISPIDGDTEDDGMAAKVEHSFVFDSKGSIVYSATRKHKSRGYTFNPEETEDTVPDTSRLMAYRRNIADYLVGASRDKQRNTEGEVIPSWMANHPVISRLIFT